MAEQQIPGTRARLIREGLEQHPGLSPEELAGVLNKQHQAFGIEFHATDIRHVKQILGRHPGKGAEAGATPSFFSDRIPPMREHENPSLSQMLAANQEEQPTPGAGLTEEDFRLLRELVQKAGSVRQLIRCLQSLERE